MDTTITLHRTSPRTKVEEDQIFFILIFHIDSVFYFSHMGNLTFGVFLHSVSSKSFQYVHKLTVHKESVLVWKLCETFLKHQLFGKKCKWYMKPNHTEQTYLHSFERAMWYLTALQPLG